MASNIIYKTNSLAETTYVAGDLATSFLAVQVDARYMRALAIFGIEGYLAFSASADRAALIQQRVKIYRDLQLVNNVALASQVGAIEAVYGCASGALDLRREYVKALVLTPGHIYTIVQLPGDFSAALAGTVTAGLTVTADNEPTKGVEAAHVSMPMECDSFS